MATANEEMMDAAGRHQIRLLRLSRTEAARAAKLLDKADKDLASRIASAHAGGEMDSARRMGALLAEVRRLRRQIIVDKAAAQLNKMLKEVSIDEVARERATIEHVVPLDFRTASVPAASIKAAAAFKIQGIPLENWLDGLSKADAARIERAVKLGVVEGDTTPQIVQRLRRSVKASTRELEALVRTSVNNVSNAARQQVWDENADIISGLRWTSTLDGRTSDICRSRDGKVFPVDKGPRPPAHFNCRSLMVPVIDGVGVIGDRPSVSDTRTRRAREADFRAEAKAEAGKAWRTMSKSERLDAQRAKRDAWSAANIGSVPARMTYDQWLRRQPTAFQDEVLGRTKGKAFRKGATVDDFVDSIGRPVSAAEISKQWKVDLGS